MELFRKYHLVVLLCSDTARGMPPGDEVIVALAGRVQHFPEWDLEIKSQETPFVRSSDGRIYDLGHPLDEKLPKGATYTAAVKVAMNDP